MSTKDSNNVTKSKVPLYISIGLLVGIVASYFFIPSVQQFLHEAWQVLTSNNNQRIEQWIAEFGWYGPFVLVLAMIIQMFLLVIPSVALMVVSVLAYGPFWGSLIILSAVFAASSVGYVIGRFLSETFIMKLLGPNTENKIEQFIKNYGFWAVFVTRLNPILSNDAISFVGGIVKMDYWRFILATLLGILPLTILIAILGENIENLKSGLLWGSIISLIAFIIYVVYDKIKK